MRIMGIDPGTNITGIGIIEIDERGEPGLCHYGCIRTSRSAKRPVRLQQIYRELADTIGRFQPDAVALEDIFYSDNIKTAIVMGEARGVTLLAAVNKGVEPAEYSPREVKLAVVGRGNASKDQVQFMVRQILGLKEEIKPADAADALAVALCHFNRIRQEIRMSK